MERQPKALRVLIVEDDFDGAISLTKLLGRYSGFDVSYTTSPVQAIADALLHLPDVVIADIGLPQMDGCELGGGLQDMIKELTGTRPLLIAVTGNAEAQERCRQAGFDHFFRKPAPPMTLVNLLRDYAHTRSRKESARDEDFANQELVF